MQNSMKKCWNISILSDVIAKKKYCMGHWCITIPTPWGVALSNAWQEVNYKSDVLASHTLVMPLFLLKIKIKSSNRSPGINLEMFFCQGKKSEFLNFDVLENESMCYFTHLWQKNNNPGFAKEVYSCQTAAVKACCEQTCFQTCICPIRTLRC